MRRYKTKVGQQLIYESYERLHEQPEKVNREIVEYLLA